MPFDTLDERLRHVATHSLAFCKNQWGSKGLGVEKAIDTDISWRPSFHLKQHQSLIVAVEVGDVLYPELLKGAAHDIGKYNCPIAVYQACSLDVFQKDPKLARVKLLRANGIGVITVDENGDALIQAPAGPLAQNISPTDFEDELAKLTKQLKVRFRTAYSTYQTNVGQGLQECGQLIEEIVISIAKQAVNGGVVPAGILRRDAALMIDTLYSTNFFKDYRAALGAARSFIKEYRNVVSHPSKTPKEMAAKLRKCRSGFLEGLRIGRELRSVITSVGYKVRVL